MFRLKSGVARLSKVSPDLEKSLIGRFRREASLDHLCGITDKWDWMVLAQHHGVPTRLLDWTENPLIALWFACAGEQHAQSDGSLFILDPAKLNSACMKDSQLFLLGVDDEIEGYYPEQTNRPDEPPIAVLASHHFRRISAQAGTFTITSSNYADLTGNISISSFTIPAVNKASIVAQLADLNITEYTIFRDLDRLARTIKRSCSE